MARRRSIQAGALLGAALALAPIAATANPTDLFYERTLVTAAGARCQLFSPQMLSALNAAAQQARGVAMRAGATPEALAQAENRARARARSEPCDSADLALVAGRASEAFEGFERLQRLRYPGEIVDWNASRQRSTTGRVWNLSQDVSMVGDSKDRLSFGLTAKGGDQIELVGVARFADGARPYAARIVMRDPTRARQPYLDTRATRADGKLPLSARVAPRAATRTFSALSRFDPDPLIRIPGSISSIAFGFPVAAADALAQLDPREAVEVEFLFNGAPGSNVRRAYVEVGDFAAGRAFMWLPQR